jgi:transcription-repair coupling factor (superfamily II helicase)
MDNFEPSLGAAEPSERLAPGPRPEADTPPVEGRQAPAAAVAAALMRVATASRNLLVYLASSDRRAEEIGRALSGMAPEQDILVLPPWDCLPYDRASPARDVMGRRMHVLRRLNSKSKPRFLLVCPETLVQRTPPSDVVSGSTFSIAQGQVLDREALAAFAAQSGYVVDDRIDEPGEIAVLGEVIDIFPADAPEPLRISTDCDNVVLDIRSYDPITQRTAGSMDVVLIGPASELVLAPDGDPALEARGPGLEHRMAAAYGSLPSLFDLLPKARFGSDEKFAVRLEQMHEQIDDAYEAHCSFGGVDEPKAAEPSALYLDREQVEGGLAAWSQIALDLSAVEPGLSMAGARNPGRAFCDFVDTQQHQGRRVVLTGLKHERAPLARALSRGLQLTPTRIESWSAIEAAEPGTVGYLDLDLDTGFVDAERGLVVVAAADVLGGRLADRKSQGSAALVVESDLRLGDVVLHEDHGIGVLRELVTVEIDGVTRDALRLEYHGETFVLSPTDEIGRIWRYGAEEAAVSLDRLKGEAWPKRRAEVSHHLDDAAGRLVALAKAREAAVCEPIIPPKAAYAKFAVRFGYPETADQAAAIDAVLADLASGRPMDRLVCGDVGFGKTEVALRAAAAVALSGRQVAICAPTTVLAKQHFQTFQRRFAGTGIKVEQLSRLVRPSDASAVRAAIAAGEAGIVIGTHALAGEKVVFADLGLMVIDEEQKFGAAVKQRLREMAAQGHLLSMTATPIPRTLQAAMIGIQDVSVIASPPARRRPIRTFLAPFDGASVRTALLREKRRGGQSFFVTPRIEDIASLADQLKVLAPELTVRVAHGELPADEVDAVMVGFADGEGDVLLATNIIESGLDVPRANTMLIWRPDRFGLSQLHQLRGRVGRGRAQGVTYLLTDPVEEMSDATRARLSTLEAFDRLGSGLAISARDLDLRGGGDITGDDQAGHMQMIGAALYHRLLDQAIRAARGERIGPEVTPTLNIGETGAIPVNHVPDAITRINLYARLARLTEVEDLDAFEEELEDRFGALPGPMLTLLAQARLVALARQAAVRDVSAGPKAVAISLAAQPHPDCLKAIAHLGLATEMKGDRLVATVESAPGPDRSALVERLVSALAAHA